MQGRRWREGKVDVEGRDCVWEFIARTVFVPLRWPRIEARTYAVGMLIYTSFVGAGVWSDIGTLLEC